MSIVPNFTPFIGEHCETVATGNLLLHAGLKLSEPMLLGLGEGIGFGVFSFKNMPAPFIAGRVRPEAITKALTKNLALDIKFRQTRSRKKAWENMASFIDAGQPVAVKLDCYYLDYFDSDFHFAGHYVAAYGYDDDHIFVVDTNQQGGAMETSRGPFEEGRMWKGPMASNALTWTLSQIGSEVDWQGVTKKAIRVNAQSYNTPPIKNFGASGIRKAALMAPKWKDTVADAPNQLALMGMLIERAGTGGGLFRRLYADFLLEANGYLNSDIIAEAEALIRSAGEGWTKASNSLQHFQEDEAVLDDVAETFLEIADLEESAFGLLATVK